ncbi:MAG: DUF202 domain-containing protein [Bacteroidia bacterium]
MFENIDRPFTSNEELILRDYLALERTRLANERTLLTYLRSTLYLLITGVALVALPPVKDLYWLGVFCLVMSSVTLVIGLVRFRLLKRRLRSFFSSK